MVGKALRACIGVAAIYGAERGAETMWPDVTAWTWWAGSAALVAIWIAVEVWLHRGRRPAAFDMPILEAIRHILQTVPHSYRDAPDMFAFDALHKQMCRRKLRVVGTSGDDAPEQRISAHRCRELKPTRVAVPLSPTSPQGLRYDLFERDALAFTSLRVRSKDLYRLWPRNMKAGDA